MSCLLCLEVTESYKDLIIFNSSLWQELNMQYIIEKHLWKLEVLNSQSYICQACWEELYNFHKFYSKLEKAHSNFNELVNTEEVTKEAVKMFNIKKVSLPEPEILFFKDEYPLDIFEKEDEEESNSVKTNSKRKCSRNKSSQAKNVEKNSSMKKSSNDNINELKSNGNPDEIGRKFEVEIIENDQTDENGTEIDLELKTVENDAEVNKMEDEIESICLKSSTKRKCSRKESTNDNKIIAGKSARQRSNNDKSDTEIKEFKFVENPDEIKTKLELKTTENDAKQNKMEEDDQNDSSTRLDKLSNEDKLVAENFQLTCDICKISMDTFYEIVKHYREIHNQRGYVQCCGIKFINRVELIDHINIHENPEYLKCKYCTKTFAKRTWLKLHTKHVHEEKRVDCDVCGKSLVNKFSLKRHMLTHNTEEKEKMVTCKHCDKSYLSKRLHKHMQNVDLRIIICHLCGKSILTYQFRRHMAQHEGKRPPKVSCKMCDRQFSDKGGLNRHVRARHPPEGAITEFKCDKCPKVFAADYSLETHIRVVHDNAYVRKCTLCDKTFKGPGALREHMSRHKGEPLYVCGICPRKFYYSGNAHTHRKTCSGNRKETCATKRTDDE